MIRPGIRMRYTNYRGETSIREIAPSGVPQFLATEYHPEPQWIMRAWDYGKADYRDFALRDCDFTVDQEEQPTAAKPAPVSDNDLYYLRAISRRFEEFREALDGIEGLSIGGEAFHDERDWLCDFLDRQTRALTKERTGDE